MSKKKFLRVYEILAKITARRSKKTMLLMIISIFVTLLFEESTLGMKRVTDTSVDDDLRTPLVRQPPKFLPDLANDSTQKVLKHEDSIIRLDIPLLDRLQNLIRTEPPYIHPEIAKARQDRNRVLREYVGHLDDAFLMRFAIENPERVPAGSLSKTQIEANYEKKQISAAILLCMYSISESEFNDWMRARDSYWKVFCCCCFFQ